MPVLTFSRGWSRRAAILAVDFVLVAASLPLSLALRIGLDELLAHPEFLRESMLAYLPIAATTLIAFRLDRIPWRYASLTDAIRIFEFAALANLLLLFTLFLLTRLDEFPRSAVVINAMLIALVLAGARLSLRIMHERRFAAVLGGAAPRGGTPVLLIGAGDEAEIYIRQLKRDRDARFAPVGALTSRPASVGTRLHGVPVRGSLNDLERIVDRLASADSRPKLLIIASSALDGATVRALLQRAQAIGIPIKRLPRHTELLRAGQRIDIEPLDLEDLLARPEIRLDRGLAESALAGRTVLVTGAGGSIGSELARQIADLGPARLVLVDGSEYNLYAIDKEIARIAPAVARETRLADIRDRELIGSLFDAVRPDRVFHAAALKHVPLLEAHPDEAVRTNVLGTRNVADAAVRAGAGTFVMVSTDKATGPVSVMGATKRIAEAYCQSLDLARAAAGPTRFVTVRFGNVLGSRGSVVPLFQEQIAHGGPITITDEAATRFFMTIREASQLVIQASVMDELASDAGSIVVLNMGEPIKIIDLARNMVRLSGLDPDRDIGFEVVGLRPGERLAEELFTAEEELIPTRHRDLMIARPAAADRALIERYIRSLARAAEAFDKGETRRLLAGYLRSPETGDGRQAAG